MAIQDLRVSVADCQQENFYLRYVKIWNDMEKSLIGKDSAQGRRLHYFPASQSNVSFLYRVHLFGARENLPSHARQIARDCRWSTSQETIS